MTEVDCAANRRLMNERLDATISAADERTLDAHLSECVSCRRDWATLVAMDMVLADEPLERASEGFEMSVIAEIIRRIELRRRIDSVVIPVACAAASVGVGYGIHRAVNWNAARSLAHGIGEATNGALAPLTAPLARTPDLVTTWSQEPGVVGAMLAMAVAAVVFLGVSAIRTVRPSTHQWR